MNDKEYLKIVADARRSVSRKYGFRQSSYINFKIEEGYFFCLYFLNNEVRLTVKPMYADELWWDIWGASENKKEPLSLRGTGAYSLSGQILASYQIEETTDGSKLTNICEEIFHNATVEISKFLTTNPDVDSFFPDESKMEHDPDRLLYLITLIHNGREDKALEMIKEARQDKHSCMFQSGMFSDSYTYIQRWCNRGQTNMRIRNAFVSIFNCIVKIRAYALMSLGGDNKYDMPDVWYIRGLDGGIFFALFVSTIWLCDNFILTCIVCALYFLLVYFIDFGKRSAQYYKKFGKLPDKTKRNWKITTWTLVITFYLYAFVVLFFQI